MFRQDREQFGDWKILKCLGSGGNGEVHLWQNRVTRCKVAIKSLKFPVDRENEKEKQRWRDEIAFARKFCHPNIVQEVIVQPEEFRAFLNRRYQPEPLIMEYCEKGDLRKKLNDKRNANGLPESDVRNVLNCLQNAVFYLQSQGVTHRDIKPENLVIKEVNGNEVYKLTDLGYAKQLIETIEASHVGTFEYFAPEVITEPSYSNTVDYWSMGIIAFEVICGCRPFLPGSPLMEFIQRIKEKGVNHIAITRFETNNYKYHSELFEQNHISSCLKQLLERWLRIPLSVNPRMRAVSTDGDYGHANASEQANNKSETLAKLKIFEDLNYAMSAKILTVFCMFNMRQYSYLISENTSRRGFLETLSLDTKIPVDDLSIILPPENVTLNRFTTSTKPIELHLADLYDKPMVYCTNVRDTLNDVSQSAGMSTLLVEALESNSLNNKKHAVEVAKHMLFYIQTQGAYSTMFLQGLLNYAVIVDDWIIRFQEKIDFVSSMFWQLNGAIEFYLSQLNSVKNLLLEKNITEEMGDEGNVVVDRCKQIRDLHFRTRSRFASILRRSKSLVGDLNMNFNTYLQTIDKISNLSTINEIYDKCRDSFNGNAPTIGSELFKCFNSFQENNWFLHSPQIRNIQATISEIHIEFELIEKVVESLIREQTECLQSVNQLGTTFNKSLWSIATNNARDIDSNGLDIPDIDNILSEINTASTNASTVISPSEEGQKLLEENDRLYDIVQRLLKTRSLDD